jgi:hypothetical protein
MCDDPNIGGKRLKGASVFSSPSSSLSPSTSSSSSEVDHSAPSHAEMSCRVWFQELVDSEDSQPNARRQAGSVQIEKIDIQDLYDEYSECMLDDDDSTAVLESKEDLLSQPAWRKIWLDDFPELVSRETKNVSSKDLVRPRLRILARDRRHNGKAFRLKVKALRGTYRKTIMTERMFYYRARQEAISFPRDSMTMIQDGATQR